MDKISSSQNMIKSKRPFEHLVRIKTEGNNLGILKTIFIFALLILEIATISLATLYVVSFIKWYMLFAAILSIASCFYVISSSKNSQSKAVWIMFLILFFQFGYLVFWLSDERIFFKRQKKRYDEIFKKSYNFQQESADVKNINQSVKRDVEFFKQTGNFSCYSNTKLTYFPSGASFYDSVLEAIEKAEKFIFLEYFIISDGALLIRFENIIKKKCEEGVDVRIIYDDMGSHRTFSRKTRKRLEKYGVKIYRFNQLISWFSFGLNYRDHRKIFVVDGKVAFTGGTNFADEYTNEKRLHGYWKDSGIKLEGEAVDGLTLTFLRQWEFVTKKPTEFSPYVGLADKFENGSVVVPFADGLDYTCSIGRDAYANIISSATQKLYIMTPYFITDDVIFSLIKNKAQSGVDVRLILPDTADKKAVYRVSRNNAEKLAKFGVKLYTMNNSFVHSKVVLTENATIVGSINFDLRSFYQQFENAVYTNDKQTMKDVQADFDRVISASTLITSKLYKRNSLINRIIAGLLGIIAPFM